MAGLLTEIDRSVWKESTFLHFKEPKEGDVKENYRFSILSLVCPPEVSTCSSNLDLIYFEDQPEGPLWLLSIFLLVSSSSGQSDIFDPLFCFCPHLRWDSWSTAPPNSPSFSYLIFQRSVGSCAAGQFCFSVFIHPPPSLQSPFILLFSSSSSSFFLSLLSRIRG